MVDKEKVRQVRDDNRAAPIGTECICPRCGNTFIKKRMVQYSDSGKCGYWIRDNIGSFKKEDKPRQPVSKPVNKAVFVHQTSWPLVRSTGG